MFKLEYCSLFLNFTCTARPIVSNTNLGLIKNKTNINSKFKVLKRAHRYKGDYNY